MPVVSRPGVVFSVLSGGRPDDETVERGGHLGWLDRLPPADELEGDMLDFAFDVQPNSRLSCQIKVDPSLDGLVVRAPARQY